MKVVVCEEKCFVRDESGKKCVESLRWETTSALARRLSPVWEAE